MSKNKRMAAVIHLLIQCNLHFIMVKSYLFNLFKTFRIDLQYFKNIVTGCIKWYIRLVFCSRHVDSVSHENIARWWVQCSMQLYFVLKRSLDVGVGLLGEGKKCSRTPGFLYTSFDPFVIFIFPVCVHTWY